MFYLDELILFDDRSFQACSILYGYGGIFISNLSSKVHTEYTIDRQISHSVRSLRMISHCDMQPPAVAAVKKPHLGLFLPICTYSPLAFSSFSLHQLSSLSRL